MVSKHVFIDVRGVLQGARSLWVKCGVLPHRLPRILSAVTPLHSAFYTCPCMYSYSG